MLVIGSGLGGSVVALQLTKKRYRTRLFALGRRPPDENFADAAWELKRFAWAPLGLKGTRHILWLPKVVIHAGVCLVGCLRVLHRIRNSRVSTNCDCAASTVLGYLRRAMRWCTAASAAAAGRSSPSDSLAGLPWHEFVRRVAAAEADAERAATIHAHLYHGGTFRDTEPR
jgi:hypothetical protein